MIKRFSISIFAWIACAAIMAGGIYLTIQNSDFDALMADFAALDNYPWVTIFTPEESAPENGAGGTENGTVGEESGDNAN